MANWEQLNFQNRFSPLIEQIIFLHDHILSILTIITITVIYTLLILLLNNLTTKNKPENHTLETLWTLLPGLILIIIAFPSLRILYLSEETEQNPLIIKTLGHQWYWSYEYNNFNILEFDRFIKSSNVFRLLDTDSSTTIPSKTPIQNYISSTDVLHAWTIPTLGIKADSVPGRINIVNFISIKPGFYFGQCSEICGRNHSFIPIKIISTPLFFFKIWINNQFLEN